MSGASKREAAERRQEATRRKKACMSVIEMNFPDFADDGDFCAILAELVLSCIDVVQVPNDLRDPLADALQGTEDIDTTLAAVHAGLIDAKLIASAKPQALVSEKRIGSVFSKEFKKRRGGDVALSAEALACLHTWDNTGAAGVHCQICDFETTERSHGCERCDIKLCGSCWWKWSKKL